MTTKAPKLGSLLDQCFVNVIMKQVESIDLFHYNIDWIPCIINHIYIWSQSSALRKVIFANKGPKHICLQNILKTYIHKMWKKVFLFKTIFVEYSLRYLLKVGYSFIIEPQPCLKTFSIFKWKCNEDKCNASHHVSHPAYIMWENDEQVGGWQHIIRYQFWIRQCLCTNPHSVGNNQPKTMTCDSDDAEYYVQHVGDLARDKPVNSVVNSIWKDQFDIRQWQI
jgi:hypothetical protein